MSKFSEVIELLDLSGFDYELIEHKEARTSAEAEAITGWPMTSGAKSIVFKTDGDYVLFIMKGDNRVDFKKLRDLLGTRKARLARPEEVLEVMGVEIGACYPFPKIAGVKGLVDRTLAQKEKISFSPGTKTHHVRIAWKDYQSLTSPKLVDIAIDSNTA